MNSEQEKKLKLLEKIIYLLPGNIYWKDLHSRHLGCNKNVQALLGLDSTKDIAGKSNNDLFLKDIADVINDTDQRIMRSGTAEAIEEHGLNANGEPAIFHSIKMPWFDEITNEVLGLWGYSFDITQERKSQEYILEKQKLEEATKYLQSAIVAVTQDLKVSTNTLENIFSELQKVFPLLLAAYLSAQHANLPVNFIRKDKLNLFQGALERSKREINFIKQYIEITLSNVKHNRINHDNIKHYKISYLIEQAISHYPFKPSEKDLVSCHIAENFDYFGNEYYFYNMINNLLNNSLYYIQKNHQGCIEIWTEKNNDEYLLYFKDSAEGIPSEIINDIFNGYFSTRQNSAGLGLTFCHSFMKEIGGTIEVESVYKEYVCFVLHFPKVKS